jgi:TonB family protein
VRLQIAFCLILQLGLASAAFSQSASSDSSASKQAADPPGKTQSDWREPYLKDLQRRIKRAWFPPKGNESKPVVVEFKVHKMGELSNLKLIQNSGVALSDQAALRAVENAAPFRPLPSGVDLDLTIRFTFDYKLFNGGNSAVIVQESPHVP